jgi:indolepyruvate ferredoxin oxidoreductase beta subunit
MSGTMNFLLTGVGGQGIILASDVLVNVGLAAGFQAKQAEVHGMSQRGGSVTSHVRWGKIVYSPLVGAGEVDALLAFEKVEALRCLNQLRPGALVLVNMEAIEPVTVTSGGQAYPTDEHLYQVVGQVTPRGTFLHAATIAEGLGNIRAANVVLLGALSALLDRQAVQAGLTVPAPWPGPGLDLTPETWLKVILARVPARYADLNRQAFLAGRGAV